MSKTALLLLGTVLVIFALGLTMVFNTTAAEVIGRSLDQSMHHDVVKQILYGVIGGVMAAVLWFMGYENFVKLSGYFLIFGSVLLILVFIPGIGQQINGARRWIGIFGVTFQPSEFVKYLIPIYYIASITKAGSENFKDLCILLGKMAIPLGLILMEPDNGTAAVILASMVVLLFISKVRAVYWALPLAIIVVVGGLVASQMPHVHDRINSFRNPESDLLGKGHQPHQAKIAAGSGQLTGLGLGKSLQKLDYLPAARSDYIAAIYAEELGFLGMLGLIFLYMMLGFAGFLIATRAKDVVGYYLATILTFLVTFQSFLNLGVVSGILPSKGINLPFVSHGGSSLIANMFVICLILNIDKYSKNHDQEKLI